MPKSPEVSSEFEPKSPKEKQEPKDWWERSEIRQVTPQFLRGLYSSPRFVKTFRENFSRVNEYKGQREFGFVVFKDPDSETVWFSKPIGGLLPTETDFTRAIEEVEEGIERKYPTRSPYILGFLHNHPDRPPNYVIIPSGLDGDLGHSSHVRERNAVHVMFDVPTIDMIAMRTSQQDVKLLVYREPLHYRLSEKPAIAEELDLTIDELAARPETTQQEVLDALHYCGYKAVILNLKNGEFGKENLDSLASFAFTVKPAPFRKPPEL
jgi:hypothetical protein